MELVPDDLQDLIFLRPHPLKGNLKDFWAMDISGNWRIIFKFNNTDPVSYTHLDVYKRQTKDERVGYKNGIVTVLLNPQLAPYFIQIAHYSKFQVESYMHLKSWYSMRFFEILSAFRDTGEWVVGLDEYRQLMDCWEQKDNYDRVKKDKKGNPVMKHPMTKDLSLIHI